MNGNNNDCIDNVESDVIIVLEVKDLFSYKKFMSYLLLFVDINVMVVMGLGFGYYIEVFVKYYNICYLVIYEFEL